MIPSASIYIDSSVLTKLYVLEPDSEACAGKVAGAVIVSSELAYGELFSALLGKERMGELSPAQRESIWREFEEDIATASVRLAQINGNVVREARAVMQAVHPKIPLRTLDAIHLATYFSALVGALFTTDRRMREAAQLLNIPVV